MNYCYAISANFRTSDNIATLEELKDQTELNTNDQ